MAELLPFPFTCVYDMFYGVQSNLSNTDTEGTEQSVRIREVSVV